MSRLYHTSGAIAFHVCADHECCSRVVLASGAEQHVPVRRGAPACGICNGRGVAQPHHCHVERALWRELADGPSVDPREQMGDYRDDDPADHGDVFEFIEDQLGWHEVKLRRRWQRAAR